MSEDEEYEAIEKVKKFNQENRFRDCGRLNTSIDIVLRLAESYKNDKYNAIVMKKLYDNLEKDFENYKNDKDINYLDGIHHKKLVEKSIGQKIDKPEECWFDSVEVKIIIDSKMYSANTKEDFISLKEISDKAPEECITVIAESPLSGAIYRYNNYNTKEWQLIGTMLGYA